MSAICALLAHSGCDTVADGVHRMIAAMHGFGESDGGWNARYDDLAVGLGARVRAMVAGEDDAVQPLASADGRFVLVADARIDNRRELSAALRLPPEAARRASDASLILSAYRAWGDDCARRLIGDFAFVLWDVSRRCLFCARDPLGQRVLFMHRSGGSFAIASSIPALLALGTVRARLNEQKVADFLTLLEDARSTYYEGIERLPAGHVMIHSGEGSGTLRRYFTLREVPRLELASDPEYREAFHDVFGEAVRARLRADGDIGLMLSGGLDSSTVAAFAATQLRESGGTLFAYHAAPRAGFEGETRRGWIADESALVREIAAMHENIDLRVIRPDERTPLDALDDLFTFVGGPVRNPGNLAWVETVHREAQRRGVRVMLTGQKGNSTISFTGLRMLRDLARRGRWTEALREARAVARRRGLRPADVIRDEIARPLIPPWLLIARARMMRRYVPSAGPLEYAAIEPDFARRMRVRERREQRREDEARTERVGAFGYRRLALTAGGNAADGTHALRNWFGIEARDPTSDIRVVNFCLSLPRPQYLDGGRDRLLVRRGLRGMLPASVLDRTERGAQGADWSEWFQRERSEFAAEIGRLEQCETARHCLDLPRMRTLMDRWPERFGAEHIADYNLMLLRALMMGRFIRWFEEQHA